MARETTLPQEALNQRRIGSNRTMEVRDRNWFGRRVVIIGGYAMAWLILLAGSVLLSGHAAGLL